MSEHYREWLDDEGTAAIAVSGGGHYVSLLVSDGENTVRFDSAGPDEADELIAKFGRAMAAIRKHVAEMPAEDGGGPPEPDQQWVPSGAGDGR